MEYGIMLAGLVAKLEPLVESWWAAHRAGDAAAMAVIEKMEQDARKEFEDARAQLAQRIKDNDGGIDEEIAAERAALAVEAEAKLVAHVMAPVLVDPSK